jgi:hypothetical protein
MSADIIDSFIDGFEDSCSRAGLGAEKCAEAFLMVCRDVELWNAKEASGEGKPTDWGKTIYNGLVQLPTPALAAGIGAIGSIPLTALFGGSKDGRRRWLRNMLIGAGLGLGGVYGNRLLGGGHLGRLGNWLAGFEADRQKFRDMEAASAPLPSAKPPDTQK